jgi:tetratricopeptide (TPR) repeat protein
MFSGPGAGRWPAALAATVLLLHGCAVQGPTQPDAAMEDLPLRLELDGTPFFPQRAYQCGPAALATVLAASGVPVAADDLVDEVYLPAREGSLQAEIIAATRQHDRLAYLPPPSLASLLAQVAAGRPVLVLQKTGFGAWPGWHYAVVFGFDLATGQLLLRSGEQPRRELSFARFMATWDRASRWAMVAVEPGTLPAAADLHLYMRAASELEAVGRDRSAAAAYRAAALAWPEEPLPRIGLANLAFDAGDYASAERELTAAVEHAPSDAALRNNRAIVLAAMGCDASARREIETARVLAANSAYVPAVEASLREMSRAGTVDAPGCPREDGWAHSPP